MASDRVLVADDEPDIRELYAACLEEHYPVDTAANGEETLAKLSEATAVVLLDRVMPGLSGDEVLAHIRAEGYDCRVAMVTAVEPDIDVAELGFDDYVVKPVSASELRNTVDSLLHWDEYDDRLESFFRTAQTVAVLEANLSEETLAESDAYDELLADLEAAEEQAKAALEKLDDAVIEPLASDLPDATTGDSGGR